jgi:hypothetical protein
MALKLKVSKTTDGTKTIHDSFADKANPFGTLQHSPTFLIRDLLVRSLNQLRAPNLVCAPPAVEHQHTASLNPLIPLKYAVEQITYSPILPLLSNKYRNSIQSCQAKSVYKIRFKLCKIYLLYIEHIL